MESTRHLHSGIRCRINSYGIHRCRLVIVTNPSNKSPSTLSPLAIPERVCIWNDECLGCEFQDRVFKAGKCNLKIFLIKIRKFTILYSYVLKLGKFINLERAFCRIMARATSKINNFLQNSLLNYHWDLFCEKAD